MIDAIVGIMAGALLLPTMAWTVREVWREQHRPPPLAPPPPSYAQLCKLVALWKLRGIRSPGALAALFAGAQRAGRIEVARWIREYTHSAEARGMGRFFLAAEPRGLH